jgi:hypothetical protein
MSRHHKGNRPGAGSLAPPGQEFGQQYKGATLVFNMRYANGWNRPAPETDMTAPPLGGAFPFVFADFFLGPEITGGSTKSRRVRQ